MGLIRGPYRSQFFFSNWDCEHFARYYIHSYHLQLAKISPFFTSFVCRYSIGEYREFIFYGVDWTNSNIHLISLQLLRQGTVSTPGPWSYLWFVDFYTEVVKYNFIKWRWDHSISYVTLFLRSISETNQELTSCFTKICDNFNQQIGWIQVLKIQGFNQGKAIKIVPILRVFLRTLKSDLLGNSFDSSKLGLGDEVADQVTSPKWRRLLWGVEVGQPLQLMATRNLARKSVEGKV